MRQFLTSNFFITFSLLSPDIPANGQLHEVMPISYTVHNRTQLVQEVESKMGQSEAFMYSGNRQVPSAVQCDCVIIG